MPSRGSPSSRSLASLAYRAAFRSDRSTGPPEPQTSPRPHSSSTASHDDSAPIRLSQALRDARPELVELETFDAAHTLAWNTDPDRWQATVTSWLRARISG
ncbi:MAG: hypothetical protein V9F04_12450 [Dermatophilaceae bacterium]